MSTHIPPIFLLAGVVLPLLVPFREATGQPDRSYAPPTIEAGAGFGEAVGTVENRTNGPAPDLLVGAPNMDIDSTVEAGRAYAFDLQRDTLVHTLVPPSPQSEQHFGRSVAGVGDVTGDDVSDLAVAADGPRRAGRLFLFDGASGEWIRTLQSPNEIPEGLFGRSVSRLGDVNGDGHADFAVGAIGEGEDRVYVFSGADGSVLHTLASPTEGHDHFGSTSAVADVNGDGVRDLLVAASSTTDGSDANAGRAYLYSGADGARLRTLARPDTAFGHFGYLAASLGDVNGDGASEVAVGAAGGPRGGGQIYVFAATSGELLSSFAPPLPQADGFRGYRVAALGPPSTADVGDLVLGTWIPTTSPPQSGRVYFYDGVTGTRRRTVSAPDGAAGGGFGRVLAIVPGATADGISVLIVGAPQATVEGVEGVGRVYQYALE